MQALHKIADSLRQLASFAEQPDFDVCPFDLRHIARQIDAQAELVAMELPAPAPEAE